MAVKHPEYTMQAYTTHIRTDKESLARKLLASGVKKGRYMYKTITRENAMRHEMLSFRERKKHERNVTMQNISVPMEAHPNRIFNYPHVLSSVKKLEGFDHNSVGYKVIRYYHPLKQHAFEFFGNEWC